MKNALLGLTVPLLLLFAAASASLVPTASAQTTLYTVSGRVVSDTGAPLSGVQVNGYTYQEDPTRSSVGSNDNDITDDEGRFSLDLAAGRGSISIWYEKWRRNDYKEITISGNVSDLTFTLVTPPPRTAIITGTVIGPDGSPVAGAEVQLSYGCCYAYPAVAVDSASTPPSEGGGSSGSAGTANATTVEPTTAEPDERAKMIAPAPYYYDDYQNTRTDSEGRFRFEAYGGPRQILAWAKGYAQTTVQLTAVENETVDVEVQLEKVPARDAVLSGRLVNADTKAPIKGATISVRSLEWGRYAEYRTGDDGRFLIETVPGWSEITVNFWGYADPVPLPAEGSPDGAVSSDAMIIRPVVQDQYFPLSVLVKLSSGQNEEDLRLEPKPKPTVALVGYVVDPDAKTGVANARVNVWNHQTGDWGEAITDSTGSFKIMVSPGQYSGNAWKEGYLSGTQTFEVDEGATERVDILLPKGVTRYAPCYDDECGPVIMYAEGKAVASSGAPAPAPAMTTGAPASSDGTAARSESALVADEVQAAGGTAGPDTSRAALFEGSGGGLPPYDPEDTSAAPAADGQKAASEVPGLGLVALLAVAALGALAIRSKR